MLRTNPSNQSPINVAVFLYDFKDRYISLVVQNFEEIQRNNPGKVQFTFYDGKNDQSVQNIDINAVLNKKRTRYSVLTINNAGIRTEELALRVADWDRNTARSMVEPLYLQYGKDIEAIISNNDEMAIGAIEALQKYGYNKGYSTKTIPVVGVDGIPEAQELIKQGIMTGSVLQYAKAMAEVSYNIGMNLIDVRPPLYGIPYEFDGTGVAVRIPYKQISC